MQEINIMYVGYLTLKESTHCVLIKYYNVWRYYIQILSVNPFLENKSSVEW